MTASNQSDFSIQLDEFDKIQETCKKILQTRHYQILGEAGIHAIMARAKTLGIHPFEALNGGFTYIHGKVGMSTEMMAALVRQRGHSITKDPRSTNECVILHGKRRENGDTWTCTFSKEDAIAAGLWGSTTWKKYPGVMLYNRCMSMLFRQLFPDLSLGAGYVEDELKEIAKVGEYSTKRAEISQEIKSAEISQEIKSAEISQEIKSAEISQEIKSEEILEEKISKDQLDELTDLMSKCPKEYVKKILSGLSLLKKPVLRLDDLPIYLFEKAKFGAMRNAKKQQSVISENDEDQNSEVKNGE